MPKGFCENQRDAHSIARPFSRDTKVGLYKKCAEELGITNGLKANMLLIIVRR